MKITRLSNVKDSLFLKRVGFWAELTSFYDMCTFNNLLILKSRKINRIIDIRKGIMFHLGNKIWDPNLRSNQ